MVSKKKRKPAKRRMGTDRPTDGLLTSTPTRPREDRHNLVALALASLVAGLIAVVNSDRVTHAGSDLAIGESRHGFPWVYLKRTLAEEPDFYLPRRIFNWPWPPVKNEVRDFSWQNFGLDLLVLIAMTVVSFLLIRALVLRYDQWKYKRG
jgi:hypothetical protein